MMSIVKRLSTTIFSRIDESVRQIENHDAVITASLKESRRKVGQVKVRLNRVRADGERLIQRLQTLKGSELKWTRRAKEQDKDNEETALACLRHRRDCRQQIEALEDSIRQHEKVETQLSSDLDQLERRVIRITEQRNLMRTRQSSAEVKRCLQEIDGMGRIDVDDTFEQWEIQVAEDELSVGVSSPSDDLEQRFLNDEERAELRAELKSLKETKEV